MTATRIVALLHGPDTNRILRSTSRRKPAVKRRDTAAALLHAAGYTLDEIANLFTAYTDHTAAAKAVRRGRRHSADVIAPHIEEAIRLSHAGVS